jgi:hypothetical protein
MKGRKLFVLVFFLLVLCPRDGAGQTTTKEVFIDFFINASVKWTEEAYLIIERGNGESSFVYCDHNDVDAYYVDRVVRKNKEPFIIMDKDTCLKTSEKEYPMGVKSFTVERFRYDLKDVEDEERDVFFNDDLGILVLNSIHWNTWMTFSYDSATKSLIDKIIADDAFFYRYDPNH